MIFIKNAILLGAANATEIHTAALRLKCVLMERKKNTFLREFCLNANIVYF